MNEDNNGNNNTPSTDPDVMPTGGSSIGQAVKNRVRKFTDSVKEGAVRGIKAVWAFLPMTVKIVVIVVIIILIVICALLLMGMIEEGTSVAKSNVDDYISGATDLDEDAKSLYDEKASLIKLKLSDVNSIYDNFIKGEKGGAETQTLMQYKIGEKDVSDDNRIVDINDKLPVYKHILLTEKYNFNSIKWYKYAHSTSSLAKKVETFKEDKELGLKYPDDSKNEAGGKNDKPTELEKFIDLTLPYLQTWYIPLAMSNASIINGTEEDNNRAPAFSYNIIKEAYSNIIVNWYELKKHTTVTQYHTYDKVEKHDVLYNVVIKEVQKKSSTDALVYNTVGYSLDTSDMISKTWEDSRTQHNTATNNGLASGIRDPMKEDLIRQNDEYTSHYYVKEADMFDAKIINEFNYQVYSDADANKRINADSSNENSVTWTKTGEKLDNKFDGSSVSYNGSGLPTVNGGKATANSSLANTEIHENIPGQSEDYRIIERKYIVTLGKYYEYENGLEHTVTRIWKDKLSQSGSETSDYTIDDLLKYNQSEDRTKPVSGMDLCGSSYSSSNSSSSSTSSGTSSPTIEIKIGSYKYPVFAQSKYGQTKHGGDTIAAAGCGLCSLTTVVGGITGKSVDPVSCGNDTNWMGPKPLAQIGTDLKTVYGIQTTCYQWANKNDQNSVDDKINITKQKITDALNNNNPVIVLIKEPCDELGCTVAHYITLVGMRNGKAVIANSAGGLEQEYSLDYIVPKMYNQANVSECGFIIANRSGSSSSTSSSSSTTSSANSGKSEDLKGSYSISKNGYDTIHKSRVTGRAFKLYLQGSSAPWANDAYQGGETMAAAGCGITSDAILCTGYGHDVTPKKINESYNGYHVGQELEKAINNGAVSKDWTSFSVSNAIKHMQDGGTFIAHTYSQPYTSREHYMAVIDIDEKGEKIYVADPAGSFTGWQNAEEFFNKMDRLTPYGKDGGIGSYDGTAVEGDKGPNGSSTVCTGTESGKYYTNLEKTDGLNRIDFMNSNPDIFHRYIRDGAEYYNYVGYSRSKLTLSYWNLKKLFKDVAEKNDGILPWAYGKTLGFDNVYTTKLSSTSTAGGGIFIWPIPKYVEDGLTMWQQITSTFGNRTHPITGQPGTMHNGIDISAGGTPPIVAAASGKVVKASDSGDGYGNCVIIQHSDGYYTLYGHMSSLNVTVGENVSQGQQIGIMGTTGNSTGNHLHFEIEKFDGDFSMAKYYTNERLDPVNFFNDDCSPVGGGSSSQDLVDFVWTLEGSDDFLKSLGYLTSDGKEYIIYIDAYAGTRAVGHGIDLDAGGFASVFEKAGYPTSVGAHVPKDFVDELSINEINNRRNEIITKVSGLNLKDYQIDALVSRSYQMGRYGWYDGDTLGGYAPGENFVNAYKKWWKNGDESSQVNYNHPLYTNFMQYTREVVWRRQLEWKLFQTGVYDASH